MRILSFNHNFCRRFLVAARIAVLASLALPAVALADGAAPVPVTIDQLIKSPEKYANKIVQIEGQIDNCDSYNCDLCPTDMTNETLDHKRCLGVEFSGYTNGTAGFETSHMMERIFRFATVVLDVEFDPTCIGNYEPVGKGRNGKMCLDRASVLVDARVAKVISRKSALNGLVTWYRFGKLIAPSTDDRAAMLKELARWQDTDSRSELAVFLLPKEGSVFPKAEASGLGCVCVEETCDSRWPTEYFAGLESPANPFVCNEMVKQDSEWRVNPY